jgi:hypothetical protein
LNIGYRVPIIAIILEYWWSEKIFNISNSN